MAIQNSRGGKTDWDRNRCGLDDQLLSRLRRIKDLVIILIQYEERANAGVVDILSIDARQNRP